MSEIIFKSTTCEYASLAVEMRSEAQNLNDMLDHMTRFLNAIGYTYVEDLEPVIRESKDDK